MTSELAKKTNAKYMCETCDYKCSNKRDYTRHMSTRKHKILTNTYKCGPLVCECGKEYKHRQSLYNHKKKCNYIDKFELNEEDISYKELLIKMMNENDKLRNTITDLIPKIGNTTTNSHNNINQKFNINVFLNEEM
jgi:hypothetical protein